MSLKRSLAYNVIWNLAGTGCGMTAGFIVAPLLIHRLGENTYGLWILIGSLTGYFNYLDLGVRGSVGRYIAFYRAKGDGDQVRATLSTALGILSVVAFLTVVGTGLLLSLFFHLFDVPPDRAADVHCALLVVGINLALTFPLSLFDATLWAFQRFDLINAIDIAAIVLRTGLTFLLVADQDALDTLAWLTLLVTVAGGAAKALATFRLDPSLRFSWRGINRSSGREIYGYGFWHFLFDVAGMSTTHLSVLLIGSWLTTQMVTSYSIALRLVTAATAVVVAVAGVFTPIATAFDAQRDRQQQQRLFLEGGKYSFTLALFFLGIFLVLGAAVIRTWVGPGFEETAVLLTILALGQTLPLSQRVTHSLILAMGQHPFMTWIYFGEAILAVGLATLLTGPLGLIGICIAFAACTTLSRGVIEMVYGCRLAGVSVREYARRALLPPLAAAILPIGLLALVHSWSPTYSWGLLFLHVVLFMGAFGAAAVLMLVPAGEYRWVLQRLPGRRRKAAAQVSP